MARIQSHSSTKQSHEAADLTLKYFSMPT